MSRNFKLQIVQLLKSANISRPEASRLFSEVLDEFYTATEIDLDCPYCKSPLKEMRPTKSFFQKITCSNCNKSLALVAGEVRAKRFVDPTSRGENGVHIRFLDQAKNDQYIYLRFFRVNPELKSRDIFSACYGLDKVREFPDAGPDDLLKYSMVAQATVKNITLGRTYFSSISEPEKIIEFDG